MRLKYTKQDGTQMEFEVGEKPITIGRSPEADVVILDEKASRIHCGVRLWDGEFYVKDLKSRNGTFVNDQKVEVAKLKPGDHIRVGSMVFSFEQDPAKHAEVALQEVQQAMDGGKGYSTILQEIVGDMKTSANQPPPAPAGDPIPVKIKKVPPKKQA